MTREPFSRSHTGKAGDVLKPPVGEILIPEEKIRERVAQLGKEISRDYKGKIPVLVNILKGGIIFLSDLVRRLDVLHEIDFMSVSSYDSQTESTGIVRWRYPWITWASRSRTHSLSVMGWITYRSTGICRTLRY
jgi:hypothetical protein